MGNSDLDAQKKHISSLSYYLNLEFVTIVNYKNNNFIESNFLKNICNTVILFLTKLLWGSITDFLKHIDYSWHAHIILKITQCSYKIKKNEATLIYCDKMCSTLY